MAYNTGNPSGSSDPRDLSDSSADIDTWATSTTDDTHPDRLGVQRLTFRGMENEFDAAQADRAQRFNLFLANSGYQFVGDYAAGIELTEYNQVVRDVSGNLWRVSASTSLPYTTTGAGLPEGGAFIAIGDADLAQNLISDPSTGQGALLVRGSVIYVDTIADLQALPTSELVDGQAIKITTTGRAGDFVWKVGDQSTGVATDPSKGVYITPSSDTTGASGAWVRQFSGPVNVKWFGAIGDYATDDTSAIQAALDYAFAQGEPSPSVYIPHGSYLISSEIDRSGDGNYINVFGDGQRQTILVATAAMNSILYLAAATDIAGRTLVSSLSFFCENLANYGVDAQSMRIWTLQDVEIRKSIVAAVRGGNWDTDILNNKIDDCAIGFQLQNIASSPSAANGFRFEGNYVSNCDVGFKTENRINDISITKNLFDLCSDAGIWVSEGARKARIDDNYFEACGKGVGVTVDIAGSLTEKVGAPIVLGYEPSTASATFSGSIDKNYFVANNTTRLIVAYNIEKLSVLNNEVLNTDSIEQFLELRELGCSSSLGGGGVQIEGYYPGITQLVGLNGNSVQGSHNNLMIDQKEAPAENKPKFFVNNPTSSIFAGGTTINESSYGGFKEFEFDVVTDGTSLDRVFSIDFTTLTDHTLLGRFIRIHYQTKGSADSSGVRCRVFVSGSKLVDITKIGTTYTESGRGITLYVPSSATNFEIRLSGVYNSSNAKMIGFCICDAAYPVANVPIAQV